MTHASWNNERGEPSGPGHDNERLEYLGDAVLELVVGDYLFRRFPVYDEGQLTQLRAALVNTTSLAMHGQPALEIEAGLLPSHAVVADLVYVPLETPLLAAARGRGLKTADGLGMLLHQAVRGFELWFGRRPEVTPELRALVEADLTSA